MRISDWSSDVCSSDLAEKAGLHGERLKLRRLRRSTWRMMQLQCGRIAGCRECAECIHPAAVVNDSRADAEQPGSQPESLQPQLATDSSEERRVGKECVSKCRYRGSQYTKNKKRNTTLYTFRELVINTHIKQYT